MLGGAADPHRDVDLGLHGLSRLADLHRVGNPSRVDDGARRAHRRVPKGGRKVLQELEVGLILQPPPAGDDHLGVLQLRAASRLVVRLHPLGLLQFVRDGDLDRNDLP